MELTHYPRLENTVVRCLLWPLPPDKPNFKTLPKVSELNILNGRTTPLQPGEEICWYHYALDFSRLFGSIACDQKIEFGYYFSNDETDADGHWVTDETLPKLNWDVTNKEGVYVPGEKHSGHYIVIVGRWLKVKIKHVGDQPIQFLRMWVRGTPF